MKQLIIPEELLTRIAEYLSTRPFREVSNFMVRLQNEVTELKVEEDKKNESGKQG